MANHAISQHVSASLTRIPSQPGPADRSPLQPGYRLVPTQIGQPGNTATVWISCPLFCTIDHANERQIAVEDVWHSGDLIDLEMPHHDGSALLAFFRLGLDPHSSNPAQRIPFIFAEDGDSSVGRYMTPDDLERFCDQAAETLAQLRAMAHACRVLDREAAAERAA
ncbi:DUF6907 domain-containing protein [Streptomyces sp. MK7]|uniref:DUF6907 domain-containing protein n=1 Tax=Streptomyces sp. MK7 TaxID=3067635 RepID=UPI002931E884|nr:hypothetical protein [Streptomyces sp. MK7]